MPLIYHTFECRNVLSEQSQYIAELCTKVEDIEYKTDEIEAIKIKLSKNTNLWVLQV